MHKPPLKEYLTRFLIVLGTEHRWPSGTITDDKLSNDPILQSAFIYRWTELAAEGWFEQILDNGDLILGYRLTQKAMDLIKENDDGNV